MLLDAGGDLIDIGLDAVDAEFAGAVLAGSSAPSRAFLSVRSAPAGSARDLLDDLDRSLDALGVDHADLWSVAGWEARLPWDELVGALAVAVATGRARYVGSCPERAWQAALCGAGLALHPQRSPLAAITSPCSLLDIRAARTAIDVAAALGASVIATAPLAGGVLTGKYRHATPPDSRGAGERYGARLQAYRGQHARPVVDGLVAAAEGLGTTPGALAVAWVRYQEHVAAAVVGARTVHQWRAALAGSDTVLPDEIRCALDEVSSTAGAVGDDGTPGDAAG